MSSEVVVTVSTGAHQAPSKPIPQLTPPANASAGPPPFGSGPPSAVDLWANLLSGLDTDTVVIPPVQRDPDLPDCMALVLPGALMSAKNYEPLCTAISQHMSGTPVNLWVGTSGLNSVGVGQFLPQLKVQTCSSGAGSAALPPTKEAALQKLCHEAVLAAARKAPGFVLQTSKSGRFQNLVVASHSLAGALCADAIYKLAGGMIQLESMWDITSGPNPHASWGLVDVPMLVLGGQLDGQMVWPALVSDAAVCSWIASSRGAAYAASHKPFILVPGLNHAQLCSMPSMAHRGDCPSDQPAQLSLDAVGRCVAAFLTINFSGATPGSDVHEEAVEYLKSQVSRTLQYVSPYTDAAGLGDLPAAWAKGLQLDTCPAEDEDVVAVASSNNSCLPLPAPLMANSGLPKPPPPLGTAAVEDTASHQGPLSHAAPVAPYLAVAKCEEETGYLQALVARAARDAGLIPSNALGKLRVVPLVHLTCDTFRDAQPKMVLAAGGAVQLQVPVFLHWGILERVPFEIGTSYCASPNMWLKLMNPVRLSVQLRRLLQLPELTEQQVEAGAGLVGTRQLNQAALDWALNAVPVEVRSRYEQQGAPFVFAPDQEVSSYKEWLQESRIQFTLEATQDGTPSSKPVMLVSSPLLLRACVWQDDDADDGGWEGGLYVKVISRAQAVEWVMFGAIKQAQLPATMNCRWGGVPLSKRQMSSPPPGVTCGPPPGVSVTAGPPPGVSVTAGPPPATSASDN